MAQGCERDEVGLQRADLQVRRDDVDGRRRGAAGLTSKEGSLAVEAEFPLHCFSV